MNFILYLIIGILMLVIFGVQRLFLGKCYHINFPVSLKGVKDRHGDYLPPEKSWAILRLIEENPRYKKAYTSLNGVTIGEREIQRYISAHPKGAVFMKRMDISCEQENGSTTHRW